MNFEDNEHEAAYRAKVRAWLAANAHVLDGAENDDEEAAVARARRWQALKAEAGYACIDWPKEWGGGGGSAIESVIFSMEEAEYPTGTAIFQLGLGVCVPTVLRFSDPETQKQVASKALRGEEIWCQLFSEPSAGSDLAGIRTRAVRDGDDWIVNGQKVWTSGAQRSQRGIVLTRTNPDVPKHKGLTMFWIDMASPGVEVRPIHQMSGHSEFNEVFFTDLRIPDSQRLGEIGAGWQSALFTLMNERLSVGKMRGPDVFDLIELARSVEGIDGPVLSDPAFRQKIASLHVRTSGIHNTRLRAMTALSRGDAPGPENSISKLITANAMQETGLLAVELQEQAGIIASQDEGGDRNNFIWALLFSCGYRIAGGTDEILRNIIAERVLGLPGEPRVDKDIAFRDLN